MFTIVRSVTVCNQAKRHKFEYEVEAIEFLNTVNPNEWDVEIETVIDVFSDGNEVELELEIKKMTANKYLEMTK